MSDWGRNWACKTQSVWKMFPEYHRTISPPHKKCLISVREESEKQRWRSQVHDAYCRKLCNPGLWLPGSPVTLYSVAPKCCSDILQIPQCCPTSKPYKSALCMPVKIIGPCKWDVHPKKIIPPLSVKDWPFYSPASPWSRWVAVDRGHRNTAHRLTGLFRSLQCCPAEVQAPCLSAVLLLNYLLLFLPPRSCPLRTALPSDDTSSFPLYCTRHWLSLWEQSLFAAFAAEWPPWLSFWSHL